MSKESNDLMPIPPVSNPSSLSSNTSLLGQSLPNLAASATESLPAPILGRRSSDRCRTEAKRVVYFGDDNLEEVVTMHDCQRRVICTFVNKLSYLIPLISIYSLVCFLITQVHF